MMLPLSKKVAPSRGGFAIVIVLAAIVLLVGVALAFLSNALQQRQISESSATRVKTHLLAEGAMNVVLDDLKSEITSVDSSKQTVIGKNEKDEDISMYFPLTAANMVPSLAGSSGKNGLENLLKRSSSGDPFYTGAPTRASNLSSADATGGDRAISLARWNKPLFLPATSDVDPAPVASAGFVAPDWVYVARDGSNPTAFSDDMKVSKASEKTVVGRYAVAIYDEGGVLDVNAAGSLYTNNADAQKLKAQKSSLAHANLEAIFEFVGFPSARATEIVEKLVTWRNEATLGATGTSGQDADQNFDAWAVSNPRGFLSTANSQLVNGKSDRIFTSRQQLQKYMLEEVASSGEKSQMQLALNYLGTFSRDLGDPSFAKPQGGDSSVPGYVSGGPKTQGSAQGGNNQGDLGTKSDSWVNPPAMMIRVNNSFTRNDGSTALKGEPLIKERFALNRLAWLTYKGPSATRSQSDPDMDLLIKKHGITWEFLQKGTADNIKKYFGLRWEADSGSQLGKWVYDQHTGPSGSGLRGRIMRLGLPGDPDPGLAQISPPREPNFFELLKAAVNVGSKAKAGRIEMATTINESVASNYQWKRDVDFDAAIIQLGANIIAQSRVDGFGVRIKFDDGQTFPREYSGVVNNPYLYRARWGVLKIRTENPVVRDDLVVANAAPNTVARVENSYGASIGTLTDPGVSMLMVVPEVWNPHDKNIPLPLASLRPTVFRVVADSLDPDAVYNGKVSAATYWVSGSDSRGPNLTAAIEKAELPGANGQPNFSLGPNGTGAAIRGQYQGSPRQIKAAGTAMTFSVPNETLFREPTVLGRVDSPAGSNLKIDWESAAKTIYPQTEYLAVQRTGGVSFNGKGFLADVENPMVLPPDVSVPKATTAYVGIPIGLFPSLWVGPRQSNQTPNTMRNIWSSQLVDCRTSLPQKALTLRMQYQDPSNASNWITYDTKYWSARMSWMHNILGSPSYGGMMQGQATWGSFIDPRTPRFGVYTPQGSSSNSVTVLGPGSAKRMGSASDSPDYPYYTYATSEKTGVNPLEWIDAANSVLINNRPGAEPGYFVDSIVGQALGWGTGLRMLGMLTQNDTLSSSGTAKYSSPFGTSAVGPAAGQNYYEDADKVVRRGSGAFVTGTSTIGLPMTSTQVPSSGAAASGGSQNRPWILNRPFRSVTELGYVFSGTPWKNLDFSAPESGDGGLLDVFCIGENESSTGLMAGKVNLNTKQVPVISAMLAGAYSDDKNATSGTLTTSVADQIATALVTRTTDVGTGSRGPLMNVSELVGKWKGGGGNPLNKNSFDGFGADMEGILTSAFGGNQPMSVIQRFRESAFRPLASMGMTRVWNVMIDLVAQSGKFSGGAKGLGNFTVEGEQRYWVHVAIDRLTGRVVDQQIEIVKE